MHKSLFVMALLAVLAVGQTASAEDMQTKAQTTPTDEPNPATGSSGPHRGHNTVTGEATNQVSVREMLGAPVRGRDKQRLGTIAQVFYDLRTQTVDLVGIQPANPGAPPAVVPLSALQRAVPEPETYDVNLGPEDLAAAPRPPTESGQRDYVEVDQQIIGRPVQSPQGDKLGKVADLVIDRGSGEPQLVLVDEDRRPISMGVDNLPKALPWSKLDQSKLLEPGPLTVNVDRQAFAEAPRFGAKAKMLPTQPSAEDTFQKVPPTGFKNVLPPPQEQSGSSR